MDRGVKRERERGEPSAVATYCICKKPDDGRWMIGCDGCDDWFHGDCVGMDQNKAQLIIKFMCPNCGSQSTWRRKCRLTSCMNEVRTGSKYCSDAHGVKFFETVSQQYLTGINRNELAQLVSCANTAEQLKQLGEGDSEGVALAVTKEEVPDGVPNGTSTVTNKEILDISRRRQYLEIAKERAKTLSAANGPKKDICGYDDRLGDYNLEVAPQELETGDYTDHVCTTEKRKCQRHQGWPNIIQDQLNLAETQALARTTEPKGPILLQPTFAQGHAVAI